MSRSAPALALSLVVVTLCAISGGVALAADDTSARHVVRASGTREHGFHVVWSDGRRWWTPTLSEDLALCHEYDRPVRRGRCQAATRTRFRWMGLVKRSLRQHGR